MDNYDKNIRKRIEHELSGASWGFTITEIAEKVGTTRITARKHLERLEKEGIVEEARKGIMRIFRMIPLT